MTRFGARVTIVDILRLFGTVYCGGYQLLFESLDLILWFFFLCRYLGWKGCSRGRNLLPSVCLPICPCLDDPARPLISRVRKWRAWLLTDHLGLRGIISHLLCQMSSIVHGRLTWLLGGIVCLSVIVITSFSRLGMKRVYYGCRSRSWSAEQGEIIFGPSSRKLVSRIKSGCPVARQPAHSPHPGWS